MFLFFFIFFLFYFYFFYFIFFLFLLYIYFFFYLIFKFFFFKFHFFFFFSFFISIRFHLSPVLPSCPATLFVELLSLVVVESVLTSDKTQYFLYNFLELCFKFDLINLKQNIVWLLWKVSSHLTKINYIASDIGRDNKNQDIMV